MKIGDEVYIHGYIDEIRKDTIIIKNEGGYFGTVIDEIVANGTLLEEVLEDIDNGIQATNSKDAYSTGMRNGMKWVKSLLDGKEPNFDDCEEPSIDDVIINGKEIEPKANKSPCYNCKHFEKSGWSHCKIHEDCWGDCKCNDYQE